MIKVYILGGTLFRRTNYWKSKIFSEEQKNIDKLQLVCCCRGQAGTELLPEMLLYSLEDLEGSQPQPKSEIASDERDHSGGLRLDNLLLLYLYPGGGLKSFLLPGPVLSHLLGNCRVWYLTLFLDTVLYMNIVCNMNMNINGPYRYLLRNHNLHNGG